MTQQLLYTWQAWLYMIIGASLAGTAFELLIPGEKQSLMSRLRAIPFIFLGVSIAELTFVAQGQGCASRGSRSWMRVTTAWARSKAWRTSDSSGWEGSPGYR
jgi:hypothetical protein